MTQESKPMTYQEAHAMVAQWAQKGDQIRKAIDEARAALGVAALTDNGAKVTKDLRSLQEQLEQAEAALPAAQAQLDAVKIEGERARIAEDLAKAAECDKQADKCIKILAEAEPLVIATREELTGLSQFAHRLRSSAEIRQAKLRNLEQAPIHAARDLERRQTMQRLFNGQNGGVIDVQPED